MVLGHVSLVRVDLLDIVALAVSTGRFFCVSDFFKNGNHKAAKGCKLQGFDW